MKRGLAVFILSLVVVLNFAQIKLPFTHVVSGGFTVHSIEILTVPQTFQGGDTISVGVKINFIRVMAQANVYSFDLKEGEQKLMSIRLIGLKLSETETNPLIYYGPTSVFPNSYQYGGFQIVGFYITKADLEAGYKEIWGWRTASSLACRNFTVIADLDMEPVYAQPTAGVHKSAQAEWICLQKTTAPGQKCQFTLKDQSLQTRQHYHAKEIVDIIVEPEPFETGQELKITVVVNSEPVSQPWDEYLVYWVTVKYQNGQTASIPHSYGTFNPNLAIIVTSAPKTNDVRNFVLDRPGSIGYTMPEFIKLPLNAPIVELEIKAQLWAGLDADRFSPHNFIKRWVAKTVFVPAR
ncbi:hypothetical protein [Pseudothermotoga sp.]|nr:hypothetical protein [Pseudothermotoga sp.]MCX7813545.1 hypothetical protein [Pseudothermotoga sp.]MDW8140534.1 hypothetical protein [Pseudothermotoga sp.]